MKNARYDRTTFEQRRSLEAMEPHALREHQLARLNGLLTSILPDNSFYREKLGLDEMSLKTLDALSDLPLTTKQELVDSSDDAGFAANLTFPPEQYSRFHRTSGTRGRPMIVLDTNEDWDWWMEVWQYVLDSANLTPEDRVLMAFSFGPFIGFWSAFDAAVERGSMVVPTGAMSSLARLELIRTIQATVVCCTPSYALHLAEVASQHDISLADSQVTRLIVAGEPGGSIPAVRERIESTWQAQVIDHSGASEVGPWGYADLDRAGIHVNEAEFIPEFIPIKSETTSDQTSTFLSTEQLDPSQLYELVLTCLGRIGSPVIRYRTGDLVRPQWRTSGNRFVLLDGGVLGRTDDMMIIRGVNVFPTSVEEILRGFPEVQEYRMIAFREGAMDQLKIEVEDALEQPNRIEQALQVQLGFRVEVSNVAANSLPRFEAKGKRFVDQRNTE
ncbi:MAG: AMP-binding protein [Planctomycetota bacterium]